MLLIGLDGAMPFFVRKFAAEGKLPVISRLAESGALVEALPCPPCDTPTNWTTIVTGLKAGEHGATSFYSHQPGEPLDLGLRNRGRTFLASFVRGPFLWEALDRAGLRCLVLNYPAGWPPNLRNGYGVAGWFPIPGVPPSILAPGGRWPLSDLEPDSPERWENLHPGERIVEAKVLKLEGRGLREPLSLPVALAERRGRRELLASPERDGRRAARALPGRWTAPLEARAEAWLGSLPAALSLRLAERGGAYRLEASPLVALEGWAVPSELCSELAQGMTALDVAGGPSPHVPMGYELLERADPGLVGASKEADWLLEVLGHISKRGLDACFLHFHLLDSVNHAHLGPLWPGHPLHSPEAERRSWRVYEAAYRLCDEFVGRAMEAFGADGETLVVVVSDHAALPAWRMVRPYRAFVSAGLLRYKFDEEKGAFVVDWERTRAFPYAEPPFVWVNLKGREPHGIVEPGEEFERVREEAVDLLLSLRDPERGERVMACVLKREEAEVLFGKGERVGDVVYFPKPGYQLFDGSLADIEPHTLPPEALEGPPVEPSRRVTGYHACYLPTARLGNLSVSAVLAASGPGAEALKGRERIWLHEVAPFVASSMGLPARPVGG